MVSLVATGDRGRGSPKKLKTYGKQSKTALGQTRSLPDRNKTNIELSQTTATPEATSHLTRSSSVGAGSRTLRTERSRPATSKRPLTQTEPEVEQEAIRELETTPGQNELQSKKRRLEPNATKGQPGTNSPSRRKDVRVEGLDGTGMHGNKLVSSTSRPPARRSNTVNEQNRVSVASPADEGTTQRKNLYAKPPNPPITEQDNAMAVTMQSEGPRTPKRLDNRPLNNTADMRYRRRLIDTLADQADDSSDSESEVARSDLTSKMSESSTTSTSSKVISSNLTVSNMRAGAGQEASANTPRSGARRGVKYTYSSQRTMLQERSISTLSVADNIDAEIAALADSQASSRLDFDFDVDHEDEEDDSAQQASIRNIHELRKSGALSRFADEMEDLSDRIGAGLAPAFQTSSSRRNALIELAQKLLVKDFLRQFSTYSGRDAVFENIGQEVDIVSGFSLVAIVVALLMTPSSTAYHTISQLPAQGIATLITSFLAMPDDINTYATTQRPNASKSSQKSLRGLRNSLRRPDVWGASSPSCLSPRILTLQFIHLACKASVDEYVDLLGNLINFFFNLLEESTDGSPDSDMTRRLILAILEAYSMNAVAVGSQPRWRDDHPSLVAKLLTEVVQNPCSRFNEAECLVVKLALNITNDNLPAVAPFNDAGLLRDLTRLVHDRFESINNTPSGTQSEMLEELVLLLNLLINIFENSPGARRAAYHGQASTSNYPVPSLFSIFLRHAGSMNEADSVEKTKINVAVGFLSIVLGYLALYPPIHRLFESSSEGLAPIIVSIRQFADIHQRHGEEDGITSTGELTARLQTLVTQLEGVAPGDDAQ